jgi:putative transcriptional regulator
MVAIPNREVLLLPVLASRRLFIAVAGALPALIAAAPSRPAEAPAHASLAGQLLIATPSMRDTRFDHAVILMVRHDETGALGVVINQSVGERPLAALLEALGEKDNGATGNVRVYSGGPVGPGVGFVLHSTDYHLPATQDIDGRVAMTSNLQILRDIAAGKGPMKSLVAFGYAGWAAGQLENELAHNAWYTAPEEPGLVFDDDRDKVWEHAVAHRTQDL